MRNVAFSPVAPAVIPGSDPEDDLDPEAGTWSQVYDVIIAEDLDANLEPDVWATVAFRDVPAILRVPLPRIPLVRPLPKPGRIDIPKVAPLPEWAPAWLKKAVALLVDTDLKQGEGQRLLRAQDALDAFRGCTGASMISTALGEGRFLSWIRSKFLPPGNPKKFKGWLPPYSGQPDHETHMERVGRDFNSRKWG